MDDLDRLVRRLVQNVRNSYPQYMSQPVEVSELYQTLIPYRHNRTELEIETNQDYEAALCQLLFDKYRIWTVAIDGAAVHGARITPHLFTTTAELDQFVRALKEIAASA